MRSVDRVGQCFGTLRVQGRAPNTESTSRWHVYCDPELGGCGKKLVVRGAHMQSGRTRSCGCRKNVKHGHARGGSNDPTYTAWENMHARVRGYDRSKAAYYIDVRICEYLSSLFDNFLSILGPRPTSGHSVDRENNDGHYSCGSCEDCLQKGWKKNVRWATKAQQVRNTSRNVFVNLPDGRRVCAVDAAREYGIPRRTLYWRLENGWPIEKALTSAGALS